MLLDIGALSRLNDEHQTQVVRFDVLISALEIHGYQYGDAAPEEDTDDQEGRKVLQKLALKAKKAL